MELLHQDLTTAGVAISMYAYLVSQLKQLAAEVGNGCCDFERHVARYERGLYWRGEGM